MYAEYARAAADIVREAGRFLKHFSDGHRLEVDHKGDLDFVTNADRESQALLARRLKEAFPSHRFVGEEDNLSDAQVAALLASGGEDDWFWVCDPLDGTLNYIHHLPVYAVSAGLVHRGQSVAGAICLPELDEVYWASRGDGAFMNGKPIAASKCARLRDAFVGSDIPVVDLDMRARFMDWLAAVGNASGNLRLEGSSCTCLTMVASGRMDAYFNQGLHAWDVAAGIVLVEEAGGVIGDIYSNPFHFDMTGGILAAAPGLGGAFRPLIVP